MNIFSLSHRSKKTNKIALHHLRFESLEDRTVPAVITVESIAYSGATSSQSDNDFTRIDNALKSAHDNDTIKLVGFFDFAESYTTSSWFKGSDGEIGTNDDFRITVPVNLNNIILTAEQLGEATIRGMGEANLVDQESFLYFNGQGGQNQGWTISNLQINYFDVALNFAPGNAHAFDGVTITNNHIVIADDLNAVTAPIDTGSNIGINLAAGTNQTISNNIIDIPGTGLSDPSASESFPDRYSSMVGIQTNPMGGDAYNNLLIADNQIRVLYSAVTGRFQRIIGVMENGLADQSNITISGNSFVNLDSRNSPGANRQEAFWITSHSNNLSGTTVAYANNMVEGAATGFKYFGDPVYPDPIHPEYPDPNHATRTPGNSAILFNDNRVLGTLTGMLIQGNGLAYLKNNSFLRNFYMGGVGVGVIDSSKLTAIDNTFSGLINGIRVEARVGVAPGVNVEPGVALLQGNKFSDILDSGLFTQGGGIVDAGQHITESYPGVNFTGLGISKGLNDFTSFTGTGSSAIHNRNYRPALGPDGLPFDLMAQGNFFQRNDPTFLDSIIYGDSDARVWGYVRTSNDPVIITVESTSFYGSKATASDNDFTRIDNALKGALPGDTVKLVGNFDFTESYAAASWARGSDGISGTIDDYYLSAPANKNNITLTADSLGDATIQGPGDLANVYREGFLRFDGSLGKNQGWTISNLRIEDFDTSLYFTKGTAGGMTAFNDTTINNNYIRIANDLNAVVAPVDVAQNIGIHYSFGTNQTISNNTIEIPGNGLSDPSADINSDRSKFSSMVGIQSNTSGGTGYNGLLIDGNQIKVLHAAVAGREQRIIGIWENGEAHRSNITISNNSFTNEDPRNNPLTNLQQAFWITSHSNTVSDTSVTYSGNTVEGASIGFKYLGDPEYPGRNYSSGIGNAAVVFTGNTVTDTATGMFVQAAGLAALTHNTFLNSSISGATGIQIVGGSKVSSADNTFTGFAVGAEVNGGTALFQGNDFRGNTSSGLLIKNGSTVDAGQSGTGTDYTDLGISSGGNNFSGYTGSGARSIRNLNARPAVGSEGIPYDVMAQGNVFNNINSTFIASTIEDDSDLSTLGFVNFANAVAIGYDLEVTTTAPIYSDHEVTYYVSVANKGNGDAFGVVLTDTLPTGATILRVDSDDLTPTYANDVIAANINTLAAGQSVTIKVVLVRTAKSTLIHEAVVTATDSALETDSSNNTVSGSIVATTGGSGVVTISKVLGTLYVKGDKADNLVQIVPGTTPDSYTIIGIGGTQIKYQGVLSSSVTIQNVTAGIVSNLGAGSDLLVVDGVATPINLKGGLTFKGGDGNDAAYVFGLTAGGFNFEGEDGSDSLSILNSTFNKGFVAKGSYGDDSIKLETTVVKGTAAFGLGSGNDSLSLSGVTFHKSLSVGGNGAGDDEVCLNDVEVKGLTAIALGSGNDTLNIVDGTFLGNFVFGGGTEDDTVTISDSTFSKAVALAGSFGNDWFVVSDSTFQGKVSIDGSRGQDHSDTVDSNTFTFLPMVKNVEDLLA